jgi:hypothetical protein
MRKLLICTLALCACAFPSAQIEGLSFTRVPTLDEIVAQVPLAFRGQVVDVAYGSADVGDDETLPYTQTTFRVLAPYRGCKEGDEVKLLRIGGPRDGDPKRFLVIPGLAVLAKGEEAIIFVDDRVHPFFGTLYGDHSVYRVAEAGGQRLVLSHNWHPLGQSPDALVNLIDRRCVPDADDRSRCRLEQVAGAPIEDDQDGPDAEPQVEPKPSRLVTSEAFDAFVRAIPPRPESGSVRPQRINGDPAAFRLALRALANQDQAALDRLLGREKE